MSDQVNSPEFEPDSHVSWGEFFRETRFASLALVCLAVWLHAADSLIVATMFPAIISDIGGAALVGWSVSLYEIGSIIAGASAALLALRHGLRGPMALAAALFGFGCLLSALASSMPVLLGGRLLQGIGGGALVAFAFIATMALFPRRYNARSMACISLLWGVSAFIGPLVGGFFVEFATWRWGFAFFALQAMGLSLWIWCTTGNVSLTVDEDQTGFPLFRLSLLGISIIIISTAGLTEKNLTTLLLITAGAALLCLYLHLDGRAGADRMLPKRALSPTNRVGAAFLMNILFAISAIAITAFGPVLMVMIHGISALTAGFIVACSSIGWTISAVTISGAPERYDRLFISCGMVILTLSIFGFLWSVPNGPVWLIALSSVAEGVGFGMALTFLLRFITEKAPAAESPRISGAMPTVHRTGYALGAAIIGIVANRAGFASMQNPTEAAEVAYWIFLACLPFAALGLLSMIALIRK